MKPGQIVARVLGPVLLAAALFVGLVVVYDATPDPKGGHGPVATSGPHVALGVPERPLPVYTPGLANPQIGQAQLCPHLDPAWAEARRSLGAAERREVRARYGLGPTTVVTEWDHLLARELGGADDIANIWPMTNHADDQRKDRLENQLHRDVCAGRLTLAEAQRRCLEYWLWW